MIVRMRGVTEAHGCLDAVARWKGAGGHKARPYETGSHDGEDARRHGAACRLDAAA